MHLFIFSIEKNVLFAQNDKCCELRKTKCQPMRSDVTWWRRICDSISQNIPSQIFYVIQSRYIRECIRIQFDFKYINPSPAEPGYILPFQTVQIQISRKPTDLNLHYFPLSMWIYFSNPDQADWLKIRSGCGISIYLDWHLRIRLRGCFLQPDKSMYIKHFAYSTIKFKYFGNFCSVINLGQVWSRLKLQHATVDIYI